MREHETEYLKIGHRITELTNGAAKSNINFVVLLAALNKWPRQNPLADAADQ